MVTSSHQKRGYRGSFTEAEVPPAKRVVVCLPQPFLDALDAYGKTNGTGRGRSITTLLEKVLEVPETPAPFAPLLPPADKNLVKLELVKKSDPLYVNWRKDHYIPDRGVVGQQLQYLVFYGNEIAGVIGGASAVYSNQARDEYFGLSDEKELKTRQLNSIVNNNIFRLTYLAPNLASIVIAMWRRRISKDWKDLYGIEVAGFETFVVEEKIWINGTYRKRDGACYRASGFELVGITKGTGSTNVRGRPADKKSLRAKKLVYCQRIKGKKLNTQEYSTSWFDAKKQVQLDKKRNQMMSDPLDLLLQSVRG